MREVFLATPAASQRAVYQSVDHVCDALNSKGESHGCADHFEKVITPLCPVEADWLDRNDALRQVVASPGTFVVQKQMQKPQTPLCRRPISLTRGSSRNTASPRDVLRNTSDPQQVLPASLMPEGLRLAECLQQAETGAPHESDRVDACRVRILLAFNTISEMLAATSTRAARNGLLRAVSDVWGAPSTVGTLIWLFGCDPSNSYDEFLSCSLVLADVILDFNVYARLLGPAAKEWNCTTCGIHRHAKWWASRTVAGAIVHTIAQPTCPMAAPRASIRGAWPRFDELDSSLADAGPAGTRVDVNGSRYLLSSAVWKTTDVMRVDAGQSLVFSPSWFHRIIPTPRDATHWSMTMRVAYHREVKQVDSQLSPVALSTHYSNRSVCFTRRDLVRALLHPHLRTFKGVQRGLPAIGCTIESIPLSRTRFEVVHQEPLPAMPPFVTSLRAMVRLPCGHLAMPRSFSVLAYLSVSPVRPMLTFPLPRPLPRCAGQMVINDRLGGQAEGRAGGRIALVAAGAAEAAGVSDANSNWATSLDLRGLPARAVSHHCGARVQLGGSQGRTD